MSLKITVAEIMGQFQPQGIVLEAIGELSTLVHRIVAIEDCKPGDMVFMDKPHYVETVKKQHPAVVVTSAALRDSLADVMGHAKPSVEDAPRTVVLVAPNVALAHALIKQKYASRDFEQSGWAGVHASAVVESSATLGAGTTVEPTAVIGRNVKIGAGCRILAGAVIENDATIGDKCIIHPRAVIGYQCVLGNEVVVGPGTVIGSEGYGYAQDKSRKSHAIPQTGIVSIEDRVRIGANCCIDRGTYKETRVGAGTKIDNLCHIAHNVKIGDDCLLTAMLCVAGSTTIGNRVITSGQTGLLDHVKVCDDVVLLHRAGVTKAVDKPGAYAGLPLQPLTEYMKNSAVLRSATDLRNRLSQLEKSIESNKEP